jgi:flavin-dependent dehydrogenase
MDHNLLQQARISGVTVLEGTSITGLIEENDQVRGVRLRAGGAERDYDALITIDATGRARALTRKIKSLTYRVPQRSRPKLVAFKAHMENTKVADGACEIYSYPGGYGGLSSVEGGISNLCFITASADVQRCQSNPDMLLRETLLRNPRAAHVLETASFCSEWLSVALERFGKQQTVPAKGLLAIGDSAGFIDPFTGSGMLMALESGELASQVIASHLKSLEREFSFVALASQYSAEYRKKFDSRFRVSGLLRCAAFMPGVAEFAIALCGASEALRNRVARATRTRGSQESRPAGTS